MLFLPYIFKLHLSKLQSAKWSLCSSYGSDTWQWKNGYSVIGRLYRYLKMAVTTMCKITLSKHLSAYWYMPNLYTNWWPLKKIWRRQCMPLLSLLLPSKITTFKNSYRDSVLFIHQVRAMSVRCLCAPCFLCTDKGADSNWFLQRIQASL